MTELLQKAFEEASKLPPGSRDALASVLLAEIEGDYRWDATLDRTPGELTKLADAALVEHRAAWPRRLIRAHLPAHPAILLTQPGHPSTSPLPPRPPTRPSTLLPATPLPTVSSGPAVRLDFLSLSGDARAAAYVNRLNQEIQDRMEKGGDAFVSNAILGEVYALRMCIVNFRTGLEDVERLAAITTELGAAVDQDLRSELDEAPQCPATVGG